jgi:hypothetical protein
MRRRSDEDSKTSSGWPRQTIHLQPAQSLEDQVLVLNLVEVLIARVSRPLPEEA